MNRTGPFTIVTSFLISLSTSEVESFTAWGYAAIYVLGVNFITLSNPLDFSLIINAQLVSM